LKNSPIWLISLFSNFDVFILLICLLKFFSLKISTKNEDFFQQQKIGIKQK